MLRCPVVVGEKSILCWLVEFKGDPFPKKERKGRLLAGGNTTPFVGSDSYLETHRLSSSQHAPKSWAKSIGHPLPFLTQASANRPTSNTHGQNPSGESCEPLSARVTLKLHGLRTSRGVLFWGTPPKAKQGAGFFPVGFSFKPSNKGGFHTRIFLSFRIKPPFRQLRQKPSPSLPNQRITRIAQESCESVSFFFCSTRTLPSPKNRPPQRLKNGERNLPPRRWHGPALQRDPWSGSFLDRKRGAERAKGGNEPQKGGKKTKKGKRTVRETDPKAAKESKRGQKNWGSS